MTDSGPVQSGQILAGKYRIDRVLGRGGMGMVVAATHITLDQRVAVKFLLPEALTHAGGVARFLREARASVRIQSEFVARVLDVGTFDSGAPYMVMEYLDGRDLEGIVAERGPLPVEEAVEYLMQACSGLADAHSLGIVHRDLKPANLFRTTRSDGTPVIKVLDFGISKVATGDGPESAKLTGTASMLGTPMYMSPEQIRSTRDVDARADIWALGTVLHELLAGAYPFDGDSLPALFASILEAAPKPIREIRPDVPEGLARAIAQALSKNPEGRFPSVAKFAQALAPFAPERARELAARAARVLGTPLDSPAPAAPAPETVQSEFQRTEGASAARTGTGTGTAWGATGSMRTRPPWVVPLAIGTVVLASVGIVVLRSSSRAPVEISNPQETAATAPAPVTAPAVARVEPASAAAVAPAALTGAPPVPAPVIAPSAAPVIAPSVVAPVPAPPAHAPSHAAPKHAAAPAAPAPVAAPPVVAAPSRPTPPPQRNPLSVELK